ncbi:MAG: hypothetical protein Q4B91_03380 [Atopobiaceae bacterium]|nr:hypothetical protein [Atopobiaceae bacterium]
MLNIIIAALLALTAVAAAVSIARYNARVREINARVAERGYGSTGRETPVVWALVPLAAAAVVLGLGCLYAQDVGEAVVKVNFGGSLAGHTTEAGFHAKAPWQDVTS